MALLAPLPVPQDDSAPAAVRTRTTPQSEDVAEAPGLILHTPIVTTLPEITGPSEWPTIQSLLPTPRPTPMPVGQSPGAERPLARQVPDAGAALTLLLLGTDLRPGEQDAPRTDTIMLVRADPQQKRIALLSLPRDLWVTVPEYGTTRINTAYVWGEIYQAPGGGMGLSSRTVSYLLGLTIDHVMVVDFEGFISLIDTLGGITVEVEKELYDPSFPTMDYGYTIAHFLPGPQQMDGATALMYSRIRHPDSDFMRTRRQQAVLTAIGQRLRERGDLQNLASLDRITGALKGYVRTDMPEERLIGLGWALRHIDASQVEYYAVSSDMVLWGVGNDPYALVLPQEIINQLRSQFLGHS